MTLPRSLSVLLALLTLPLAGCGGGGAGPAPAGSSFLVVASTPPDGGQAVALDATVRVTFSMAIDPASVTSRSLVVGVIGSGEIPGTAALASGDDRALFWTPSASLVATSSHACQIASTLRSVDGDFLSGDRQITFRTGGPGSGVVLPPPTALRPTGTLRVGRRSHTATLLTDGRVLVAGGFTQGTTITDQAETFASEAFRLLPEAMRQERAAHTATRLLSGRVLLAGGWYEASPGQIATTPSAEVLDPVTNTFTEVGSMSTPRVDHAAVRLSDGRVLITGGSRLEAGFLTDLDSAEVFDPVDGTFTLLDETLVHTRATHVMQDMGGGQIVLAGGSDTDLRPEVFDVATGRFLALLPAAQDGMRFGAMGASFASGAVCVAGGDALGTVLYVEPETGFVYNTGSALARPRAYGTATRVANDRVLVAGGFDLDRGFFMLHSLDLVVEGGLAGSQTYETALLFPVPLALHTATRLADGRVLFCGGLSEESGQSERNVAYIFTP